MLKKITIISLVVLTIFSCDNKQNSKPATQPIPQVKQVVIPDFNADSAYNYKIAELVYITATALTARISSLPSIQKLKKEYCSQLTGIPALLPTMTLMRKTGTLLSTELTTEQAAWVYLWK